MFQIAGCSDKEGIITCESYKSVNKIITLLTYVLLSIFPIFYHNKYFDILSTKYRFFYMTIILMALVSMILVIYFDRKKSLVKDKEKNYIIRQYFDKIQLADVAMMIFCVISMISTLLSQFKYESFWGNEGRYSGLFLILIYGLAYFMISRGVIYSRWLIEAFLVTSMLVCLLGILQYFRIDILGFKERVEEYQYNMFASTIGNINTYTAYVAMVMGISTVLFARSNSFKSLLWHFFCMVTSFVAMITGLSDNAYLAIGALFAFLPLWIFKEKNGLKIYIFIVTLFIYIIYFVNILNQTFPDHILQMDGILNNLSGYSSLKFIVAGATFIFILIHLIDLARKDKKSYGKELKIVWSLILILFFVVGIYALLDANIAGNGACYGSLGKYLVFNDDWGTHRGYIWRIGFESYKDLPFINKIFGNGPDTFGLLTVLKKHSEMLSKYNEYFDSAHNEYLQYFFTIGPFGLISYIMILVGSGIKIAINAEKDPYLLSILFAMICYAVQATVNISVPITTPLLFILIAIGMAGSRNVEKIKIEDKDE